MDHPAARKYILHTWPNILRFFAKLGYEVEMIRETDGFQPVIKYGACILGAIVIFGFVVWLMQHKRK
jgi:hypothetical protein